MKSIILLFLLTLISCQTTTSQKTEVAVTKVENQQLREEVALEFINGYVAFSNSGNVDKSRMDWVSEQSNVTETFKTALAKLISDAEKEDPEHGLGFDPIFNAQDYPDKGFTLIESRSTAELVTVKAIDWPDWEIKIKMKELDKRWLVDGIGAINMPRMEGIEK